MALGSRRAVVFVAITILFHSIPWQALPQGTRIVTPEDVLSVRTVDKAELSGDGSLLLIRENYANSVDNSVHNGWDVVRTSNATVTDLHWLETRGRVGEWSLKPETIQYDNGDKSSVCTAQLSKHITNCLALNVPDGWSLEDLSWLPLGNQFVYLVQEPKRIGSTESKTTALAGVEASPDWLSGGMPGPNGRTINKDQYFSEPVVQPLLRTELWLYDTNTHRQRRVSRGEEAIAIRGIEGWDYDLAPDGKDIAFVSKDIRSGSTRLYRVNLNLGAVVDLGEVAGETGCPTWSPDGKKIALLTGAEEVSVVDARTGARLLTSDASLVLPPGMEWDRRPIWNSDGKSLLVHVRGHMRETLYRLEIGKQTCYDRFPGPGTVDVVSRRHGPGEKVIVARQNAGMPQTLYLLNQSDFTLRELFDPNSSVRSLNWPTTRELEWPSADGRFTIHGILLEPSDVNAASRRPLVVDIEGGPSSIDEGFYGSWSRHPVVALASQGYSVFVVQTRGRNGYGDKFTFALRDDHSRYRGPLGDVLSGVDLLISEGTVDPQRIGMMGQSYGGQLTAWAVTQTNRFRAVSISEGPIDDLPSLFASMGSSLGQEMNANQGHTHSPYVPSERKLAEEENTIDHLDAVDTPSLQEDGIESLAQTAGAEWYQAMTFFKIPCEFVVYPRSGHMLTEPALLLDSFNRNLAWFDYWLRDKPYPDLERQKVYDTWEKTQAARGDHRWSADHNKATPSSSKPTE